MSVSEMRELPAFELKTRDGRFLHVKQSVDRHMNPVLTIDIFSATMERQATCKVGFADIQTIRTALQTFAEAMLETMCDY